MVTFYLQRTTEHGIIPRAGFETVFPMHGQSKTESALNPAASFINHSLNFPSEIKLCTSVHFITCFPTYITCGWIAVENNT